MAPYDWKKSALSAMKAGAYVAIGVLVSDPSLTPALSAIVPPEYRQLAALVIPAALAAIKNWLSNRSR